jgi:hypothetical protein
MLDFDSRMPPGKLDKGNDARRRVVDKLASVSIVRNNWNIGAYYYSNCDWNIHVAGDRLAQENYTHHCISIADPVGT